MATASAIPLTGMPEHLASAVNSYDEATRRTIITNWALLGSDGRQAYCNELARGSRWTRRWRCEVAAARLATGG